MKLQAQFFLCQLVVPLPTDVQLQAMLRLEASALVDDLLMGAVEFRNRQQAELPQPSLFTNSSICASVAVIAIRT